DVLPFFRKAEDNDRFRDEYHGQGGPLWVSDPAEPHQISKAMIAALHEYGLPHNPDLNGKSAYGAGLYQVNCRRGRRASSAVSYLHPVARRPNLEVRTKVQVARIVLENMRAVGITYQAEDGEHLLRARREVLVAA